MARLVAETLYMSMDKINVVPTDNFDTVYRVYIQVTRGTYAGGGAAVRMAEKVKNEICETTARYLKVQPEAKQIKIDSDLRQAVIYVPSIPSKHIALKQLAFGLLVWELEDDSGGDSFRPVACPPAYVTVVLEVEVDTGLEQ